MNRFYLLLSLMLLCKIVFSQTTNLKTDVKSPNVANLGTFGEIPVSPFSGTPDISIPLAELKGKDLTLPIVLRYHPGSVKPNQRNGWLGTGWNMSMGTIYREVHGQPDEMDNGSIQKSGYYYRRNLLNNNWYQIGEAPNLSGTDRIVWHRSMAYYTDLEPDIFHFNVMGLQGSFFLDQNGKWQVQSDQFVSVELDADAPLIDPLTKYSFESSELVSKCFNKFILKDGYGNKYVFGGVDATEYTSTINVGNQYIGNSAQEASGLTLQASSWSIIEIQSANQVDKINFKYERGPYVASLYKYAAYNQTFKNDNCRSFAYQNWNTGGALILPVYPKEVTINNQKLTFSISKSQELNYDQNDYYSMNVYPSDNFIFKMGTLISNSSQYVPYYNGQINSQFYNKIVWMKLDSISLSVDNVRLKTINFGYNNISTERLFLTNLTQSGQNTSQTSNYSFTYNQKEQMPKYLKNLSDHWGFDNGNVFSASFSPNDIFSQRQPNASYLMLGVLKEIKYPTGGKTVFDYQIGDYSKIVDKNNRKSLFSESGYGGIRIWKIRSYDDSDNLALEKEYVYNKNAVNGGTVSSGILNNKPLYYIGTTSGIDMSGGTFSFSSFKSSSVEDLTDQGGVSIGYSEVTEIAHANGSKHYKTETFTNHDNGFTDDNPTYNYNADLVINKPVNSRSFERGRSLQTTLFDDSKNKVKATRNTWKTWDTGTSSSRAVMFNYMDVSVACNVEYYYPSSVSYLQYYHPITLQSTVDTLFNNSGVVASSKEFEYYLNYKLLKRDALKSSLGDTLATNHKYSFAYGSGISDSYSVYDRMIAQNMLCYPIEETITKNNQVVQAKITQYGDFENRIKPSSSFQLETTSPLASYNQTNPIGNTGELQKDYRLKIRESVLKYDSFGNPLEIMRFDHSTTSYLWGYNGQYLIAEAIGSNNNEIAYANFSQEPIGSGIIVLDKFVFNNGVIADLQDSPLIEPCIDLSESDGVIYAGTNTGLLLDLNKSYILSYWEKNSKLSFDGFNGSSSGVNVVSETILQTQNGWNQRQVVFKPLNHSMLFSHPKTGYIQEMEIYPVNHLITTYSYKPLVGMIRKTDPRGGTEFYLYDGMQRLKAVLDQFKQVKQTIEYHYRSN